MSFPLTAYLAAGISGFIATICVTPLWLKWCRSTGHVDDPGHRKIHSEPMPLAGGLAVMTGLLVPIIAAAAWLWISNPANPFPSSPSDTGAPNELLGYGLGRRLGQLAAIFLGGAGMLALGWYDDRHELKPLAKLVGQLLVACVVAGAGVRITLFVPNLLFSYAITVLWILTIINAMNFLDNMNGLCAGLSVIGSLLFGLLAAKAGQYLVASMAFLSAGSFAGFLPYNFPAARSFLGDAGSHLAGYILAVLAILPNFYWSENPRRWAVLAPLLVLAIPLADLVRVVILRTMAGKPFYIGDKNHISHRLEAMGFSRPQAVIIIWVVAAIIGGVTLLA
jgi:UDP-GlcNAc:undecaprenyl-phosphate GlcNAc-1-phosphate transferase